MNPPDPLRLLLGWPLFLAGALLPGWFMLRALRMQAGLAMSFVLSVVILYNVVIAFGITSGRVALAPVAYTLAAICVVLWRVAPRWPNAGIPANSSPFPRWLFVPLAIAGGFCVMFVWRSWLHPLAGPDTAFRWNLLPQLMLATGRLDFYPPVTARDFQTYFFFDGFPPLVASLYWWTYAALDSVSPRWAALVASAQFAAIVWLIGCAVTRLTNRVCGVMAATCLAATPLLFWSVSIGQETGCTALCVAATTAAWAECREDQRFRTLIPVAMATQLGAVAREYGPIFIAVGMLIGASLQVRPRRLFQYFLLCSLLAAPWFVHVWLKVGNPFYSVPVGGLFTVPPQIAAYWNTCAALYSPSNYTGADWRANLWQLLLYAPLIWLAIAGAGVVAFRRVWLLLAAVALGGFLWFSSIRYTTGGWLFSLRVLAPTAVIGALIAGIGLHHVRLSNARPKFLLGLAATGLVALFMGVHAHDDPWRVHAPVVWQSYPWSFRGPLEIPLAVPAGGFILADDPYLHAHLLSKHSPPRALPVWAPNLAFLFDPNVSGPDMVGRLKAAGVTSVAEPMRGLHTKYFGQLPFYAAYLKQISPGTIEPGFPGRFLSDLP